MKILIKIHEEEIQSVAETYLGRQLTCFELYRIQEGYQYDSDDVLMARHSLTYETIKGVTDAENRDWNNIDADYLASLVP